MSGWYWFATELDRTQDSMGKDGNTIYDDNIWFGYVQGSHPEWGYFAESDLRDLSPMVWEIKEVDLPHAGRRN